MIRADAAIAGGGPAGAALARRLAQLGHRVVLIERRPPAAEGFAESLPPGADIHLQTLGIDRPPFGAVTTKLVRWDGETVATDAPSCVVDRAVLDAHLVGAAADAGALVLQPAAIESFARIAGGWRVRAGGTEIEAAVLADATGRAGLLRLPRRSVSRRAFALRARWNGIAAPPELRIERRPGGWIWGAPRDGQTFDVALFTEELVPALEVLRETELFAFVDRAPDATQVCDATPFLVDEPIGADYVVAGDAACTIDPLSSAGVQKALGGAIAAAVAVHTILAAPERSAAAIEFYRSKLHSAAARHASWAAELYGRGDEKRAVAMIAPGRAVVLHPHARIVDAPVIAGDLIEMRRAVETPAGERVAWLGTTEVAPLLAPLREGMTAAELARSWRLPPREALAAMEWLVANEVLACRQ